MSKTNKPAKPLTEAQMKSFKSIKVMDPKKIKFGVAKTITPKGKKHSGIFKSVMESPQQP